MAISHSSAFLIILFFHIILISSASSANEELSPSSAQIKFWYENVENKMPNPIIKKLSPLSKENCDHYLNMISKNNKFTSYSKLCSIANLACTSVVNTEQDPISISSFNGRTSAVNTELDPISLSSYNGRTSPVNTELHPISSYNGRNVIENFKMNVDPFSFFRLSTLKVGNLVHLPNLKDSLPHHAFLPIQIASQFSLSTTDEITKIFPGSTFGATKESIENTLSVCNAKPINGEMKSCPKSLEEMISFAKSFLGGKMLLALTSESTKGSNKEVVVKKIRKFNTDKIVACHEVYLPFATYFCHSLSSTILYEVDFVDAKTRASVSNNMLAVCHFNTSAWPADHVSFKILKSVPGEGEACHWLTQLNLAWIAADHGNNYV